MISCTVIPAIVQRLCFSINVQHPSCFPAFVESPAVGAVKTPVGAVAKNTKNCFHRGGIA